MNAVITIIKAGSTFPELCEQHGDFEDWIANGLQVGCHAVHVLDVPCGDPLVLPKNTAGIVITGSHAMVTDHEPWSDRVAEWLRDLVQDSIPLLGICYGHQLLAHALGGKVEFHPHGAELGTVTVHLEDAASEDPLFSLLPTTFRAHVAHRQSVERLPPGAVILALNGFESHHAFRVGTCAWGVQFHPEFNAAITEAYLAKEAVRLYREGLVTSATPPQIAETPAANSLLQHFAQFALQHYGNAGHPQ